MQDISGFGFQIQLVASVTYPAGIILTQFADDIDPLDVPSIPIADKAMGSNGDLITWSKASSINLTLGIIPDSDDDINLQILLEANRIGLNKLNAGDKITLVGVYQSGIIATYSEGRMTDGIPGTPIANSGRLKSKPYIFTFEKRSITL